MSSKVAVVTGSNKGVGFAIVRALCKQFPGDVYLTSRDDSRGQAAVQALEKEGLHPKYHQLDINDHSSIVTLRDFLQTTYGGLDVLVNNAAIACKRELPEPEPDDTPFGEQIEMTCKTNYFATLDVCDVLFPLLRPHARVCNVSSGACKMAFDKISQALKDKLFQPDIEISELSDTVKAFVKAAKNNTHLEEGFTDRGYDFSKLCLNIMTEIHQKEMDKTGKIDVIINSCSPGYVATDMVRNKGDLTIDEGAVTPTYIALLPPNVKEPRGKFLRNKKVANEWKQ
ncbi:carbonyl reductase [NADPH] 1 [Plakobranchus ocellatus]|uniref:carbonyl reductase (NADPH) n=1 Tax=Plakobranchus ocellatus TaxID=259542 RepID=A0AAV4D062_9GAST|nr:carbonyl reductase [NADPH] 1 [Plakobranchus ocellatus]